MQEKSLSGVIKDVTIRTGTSKKSGNQYSILNVKIDDGVGLEVFLNTEQASILRLAEKLAGSENTNPKE